MISDDHETDCKKKRNNEFVVAVVAGNKPLLPLQRLAAASSGHLGGRFLQPLAFNLLFSLLCIGLKVLGALGEIDASNQKEKYL